MPEAILDIIIKLGVSLLGLLLGVVLQEAKKYLQAKLSNEEQAKLESLVKTLVAAAEQMYGTEDPDGGKRLGYVQNMLRDAGVELTEVVRSLIEAQVQNLNSSKK